MCFDQTLAPNDDRLIGIVERNKNLSFSRICWNEGNSILVAKQFIVQTNFRTRTTRFASIFTRKKNWYSFLFVDCVFFSLAQLLFSSRIKHDLLTRVGILHASTQFLNAIYKIHHPSRGICAFVLSVSQPVSFNCFPTRRNGHEFNEIFKKERMTSRENKNYNNNNLANENKWNKYIKGEIIRKKETHTENNNNNQNGRTFRHISGFSEVSRIIAFLCFASSGLFSCLLGKQTNWTWINISNKAHFGPSYNYVTKEEPNRKIVHTNLHSTKYKIYKLKMKK